MSRVMLCTVTQNKVIDTCRRLGYDVYINKGGGMSQQINTELIELAQDHMDYWAGTVWVGLIESALERHDLERLHELLKESSKEMFNREYNPEEV
jgi:hypothetical protein